MRRLLIFAIFAAQALIAADPYFDSAEKKLDLLENGHARRGSVIVFSPQEINAWARHRVPEIVPQGIRNQSVTLGADSASAYALMDFLKMRQGQGKEPNWLISKMIEGERPVTISIRMQSGGGQATVYLTKVEISNAVATGTVLDFLIKTFFLPLYPTAHIDEPFEIGYNIDRIDIRTTGVRVTMKK